MVDEGAQESKGQQMKKIQVLALKLFRLSQILDRSPPIYKDGERDFSTIMNDQATVCKSHSAFFYKSESPLCTALNGV